MRRSLLPALLLVAVAALARPARAHVAPSEDTDNRYVKLTPMRDRVRVAYTILVGQQPGNDTRRSLDADHDGVVSEAESAPWVQHLADSLRDAITLTVDGAVRPVQWAEVHLGMDDRGVDAGAFAVDLIAWACVPSREYRHTLELADRWPLTPPGETEVRIADEPGVKIEVARAGAAEMVGHLARFQAIPAPLADGVHLVYDTTAAQPIADDRCPRAARPARSRVPLYLGGAALALLTLTGLAIFFRSPPERRPR